MGCTKRVFWGYYNMNQRDSSDGEGGTVQGIPVLAICSQFKPYRTAAAVGRARGIDRQKRRIVAETPIAGCRPAY